MTDARQLDLFADRGLAPPEPMPASRPRRPDSLTDDEILDRLPDAGIIDAVVFCDLIVERGICDRALPALDRLWQRFRGFGREQPLPELEAVVNALARVGSSDARSQLARYVTETDLPPPLLPKALQAALAARLRLPREFTSSLLRHANPEIRSLAARLCRFGTPDMTVLEDLVGDPDSRVRRAAAIALGGLGRASAKDALLGELRRNPTSEIVVALSGIADDDVAVQLGRCAEAHPALAETVATELEAMETDRSRKIARRIRGRSAGSD